MTIKGKILSDFFIFFLAFLFLGLAVVWIGKLIKENIDNRESFSEIIFLQNQMENTASELVYTYDLEKSEKLISDYQLNKEEFYLKTSSLEFFPVNAQI